ncbi:MAG TPA: deoxyguanosinetriphosphate triphosphohydrolase [Firmicutes bacterium]|jgi:dGTPase|nr:deoxyguanosinetriphosphate triphosphohydrolase [Bacillota bacterium]
MVNKDVDLKAFLIESEDLFLSKWAIRSTESAGRLYPEPVCPLRLDFQRDRDRIIHSKAFRRLKHKTQVFIAPEGDHYRTRLTHTLEVAQISRTIARLLRLNEDLTEAIALGHDLGHTPFGHAGEVALNQLVPDGFHHNLQSLRVVDYLEDTGRDYPGLNLTVEVRDGIVNHTGPKLPMSAEGRVVRLADRIAYVNHDLDDAVRGGIIQITDLPDFITRILGTTASKRLTVVIRDIVENSYQTKDIVSSPEIQTVFNQLRDFLFERVYIGSVAKVEEIKVFKMLGCLYEYFGEHRNEIPEHIRRFSPDNPQRAIIDYIAGMTDQFATETFVGKFVPHRWEL